MAKRNGAKKSRNGARKPRRKPSKPRGFSGPVSGLSARERQELAKIFAQMLRGGGNDLADDLPPLDAQAWASSVWGVWYGVELIDADAEEMMGGGFIRYAARSRTGAALKVLRALGAVAAPPYARRASTAADRLAGSGVEDPPWAAAVAQAPSPTGAFIHEDPIDDDGVSVIVGFERPAPHALGVYIDRNMGGIAKDGFLAPAPLAEIIGHLRRHLSEDEKDEDSVIRPIPLDEAAARWREGFAITDMTLGRPLSDDLKQLRALALARLAALPADGEIPVQAPPDEDERNQILEAFLGSKHATALNAEGVDEDVIADLAHMILWYSSDYAGGMPLRFSPVMVEVICCDWAPRKIVGFESTVDVFPDVLRAWIRFAGERRGIPLARVQAAVDAVAEHEDELRAAALDPSSWGPAKALVQAMQAHGVDPTDPEQSQRFVDQVNAGDMAVPF